MVSPSHSKQFPTSLSVGNPQSPRPSPPCNVRRAAGRVSQPVPTLPHTVMMAIIARLDQDPPNRGVGNMGALARERASQESAVHDRREGRSVRHENEFQITVCGAVVT